MTEADPAIEETIVTLLGEILYLDPGRIDADLSFTDLGLDSILAVEFAAKVRQRLGVKDPMAAFYEHGTPRAYGRHLAQKLATTAPVQPA